MNDSVLKQAENEAQKYGGLGGKFGEGGSKIAYTVGDESVLIVTKEGIIQPALARAKYNLGKVLHGLLPDNFPNIHLSSQTGLIEARAPETPVFAHARAIDAERRLTRELEGFERLSEKDRMWLLEQQQIILANPGFQELMRIIGQIMMTSAERTSEELALPTNTVIYNDGIPMIVDSINPITANQPTLIEQNVLSLVNQRLQAQTLEQTTAGIIQSQLGRYVLNIEDAINARSKN